MPSSDDIVFDQIAERYDRTRGGEGRGQLHADAVQAYLAPGSSVLEIGVGTGLVAGPLVESGHQVVGIDMSRAMLDRAVPRVGSVVEGDAAQLPFAGEAFNAIVAVWALHVIGEQTRLVAELGRVMQGGGRLVVVSPRPDVASNDLTDLAFSWARAMNKPDRTSEVLDRLIEHGWTPAVDIMMPWEVGEDTPRARADSIEARDWSSLWQLDEETWQRFVQPAIDGLRALPDPDRPRPVPMRYQLWVLEVPDG